MRYNKFFANFKSFVIFSALCLFFQTSFADDSSMCSTCKIRSLNSSGVSVVQGEQTVCSCQSYCEVSDDADPTKIVSKVQQACKDSYYPLGKFLENPEFEPKWTSAIDTLKVSGGQYIEFKLEGGMTYRWTTYDELEDYSGTVDYYKSCQNNSECGSQMKCYGKLSTGYGYCMWPFDTELTLIDTTGLSDTCSNGKVLAFSRSGGYENQSAIEYKAPRDMKVTLLITNNKYNEANNSFVSCQDSKLLKDDGTTETMMTMVKWQRYIENYCSTCGDKDDYDFNKINNITNNTNPNKAPNWSGIQDYAYIDLPNYASAKPAEKWLKPGSYVDFNVEEGKIYRWATCKSVFFDTQITLFKPDGDEGCGQFLAFDDDSETSYIHSADYPQNPWDQAGNAYCPAGTKQSVLEWHANFTGKVRLLFNEYNCSQCAKDNNSTLHWTHCFRVTEDYALAKDDEGHILSHIVQKDDQGFPVVAGSSTSSTEKETLTYLYSFPLDWQRYDCNSCSGTAAKEYVADFCGYAKYNGSCVEDVCDSFGSYTPFCTESNDVITCGDEVPLQSGEYMTFALRRGSKYIFQTPGRDDVLITVKAGASCENGVTLTQGRGQVAYFAETSAECFESDDDDTLYPHNYSDVVTVLVSEPECDNNGANINLKYSFYTGSIIKVDEVEKAADANNRFVKNTISGKSYYEDAATGIRFIEAEKFAGTWEEAIDVCQNLELGGDSGAFDCAPAACPQPPDCGGSPCYTLTDPGEDYTFCVASGDKCAAPKCNTNFEPYVDSSTGGVDKCDQHPELCGLCISSYNTLASAGGECNKGTQKNSFTGRWTSGTCAESNTCVTRDNNEFCRNIVGVIWGCQSDGYTSAGDSSSYCYTEEGAEDLYYEPSMVDAIIDRGEHHANDYGSGYGSSCPEGSTPDGNFCTIDNCGKYSGLNNAQRVGSNGVLKDRNKCYKDRSLSGEIVPCCCNTEIYVYNETTHNQALDSTIPRPVIYYATRIDALGVIKDYAQMSCQEVTPCAEGYTYLNNTCYKCSGDSEYEADELVVYANNSSNAHCKPKNCPRSYPETQGDMVFQHCILCQDGSTPVEIEDGVWKCSLTCNQGGTLQTSGTHKNECKKTCSGKYINGDYCYPRELKTYRCDTKGDLGHGIWIERGGFCKRIDSDKQYPDCSFDGSSSLESTKDHTCRNNYPDDYAPNTIDCWCKTNQCGVGTQPKKCDAYDGTACRIGNKGVLNQPNLGNANPCKGRPTYPVTEDEVDGSIYCSFTDLTTSETCGKPSKGWTLPDINQLYSLVDFDLYDPATAFPFRTGTYNRLEKKCYSNSDCGGDSPSCDMATHKCKCSQDTDCSADGQTHLCIDGKCARNNWFWSNTNVLDKDNPEGQDAKAKFAWAVNMEDGRSYRVLKGCYRGEGDPADKCDSYQLLNLTATPYQVMCIKGSTFAALFHSGLPQTNQIFSGWACDKEKPENILTIYFEITDSEGKNIASLFDSDSFVKIPGTNVMGILYGKTDSVAETDSDDYFKIEANCNGFTNKQYVFKLDLNNAGDKQDVVNAIKSIKDHGKPPYYVTAYAVDTTIKTAAIVQPSKERFVLGNVCGDKFKTYDGTTFEDEEGVEQPYLEDCEYENFETDCKYTSPWSEDPAHQCKICDRETCLWTKAKVPGCGDGKIQSKYCVKSEDTTVECGNEQGESCKVSQEGGTTVSAYTGCEYYDFEKNNLGSFTEHCDCGNGSTIGMYLLNKNNDGTYSCGSPLEEERCPDGQYYDGQEGSDAYCVVCKKCTIYDNEYKKPYCGDGSTQSGKEECDDGNLAENDDCLNNCKAAYCGDGKIRSNPANTAQTEVCDAGSLKGTYEGGCSDDCKTVYKCGDGVIQHKSCVAKCNACDEIADEAKKEDCKNTWCNNCVVVDDAEEECDEGYNNGQPITYQRFIDSLDADDELKDKCAVTLNGTTYPISERQTYFETCLNRYKAFVEDHACNDSCKKLSNESNVSYCGDGITDSNAGEFCDDGYDTTQSKYNGKGGSLGCSLDCKFQYGCGRPPSDPQHINGTDSNGIIDRPDCFNDMYSVPCDENTPKNTIGLEYPGESVNGEKRHESAKKVILFVNMAPDNIEDCDAGGSNGKYGRCNATCTGKPFCGDNSVAGGDEQCDKGKDSNRDIETAWSEAYGDTCIGVFNKNNDNVCLDSKDKWVVGGKDIPCCTYGRWCGDGIIDNHLDGVVGVVGEGGGMSSADEWRKNAGNWGVQDGSSIYVSKNEVELGVNFTITNNDSDDQYHDVELNINIPIVEGYRYFVEYDVKVQKFQSEEPATMRAGAKMYDSDGGIIPSCGTDCLATNPLFFVGGSELANGKWTNQKNQIPIVTTDGVSTSNHYWQENTDHVKIYFQFQGPVSTSFLVRGLKVYTLESGKGNPQGIGANEMCDNGDDPDPTDENNPSNPNYNLGVAAAKADTSYMSGCTKYVKKEGDNPGQPGCRWTNYCGDKILQSKNCSGGNCKYVTGGEEICDNGSNKTNVYNGCEPGCTAVGPHCGDAILDVKNDNDCPFRLPDEELCENPLDCNYTIPNWELCNKVSEKYDADTYDEDGNFTGNSSTSTFVSEQCDYGVGVNSNKFTGTNGTAALIIDEKYLNLNNYGDKCRTDCTPSRCGDGILDYVVRATKDSDGNLVPKEKIIGENEDGTPKKVYEYVEECDCGLVDSANLLLPIPAGDTDKPEYALNQKSEGQFICIDSTTNKYYPNSNFGGKPGVSCRANCTISRCGDGIKDFGEQCDDGNNDDHDDCTNNCKLIGSCGDGVFSFKRSYLCEELLGLPIENADPNVPTIKTMRARGVVDCCDDTDTACQADGTPKCSTLYTDLTKTDAKPYGDKTIDGKNALHYWFERKIMHCCFNKKYETGKEDDDDKNCINPNHVEISKTLKGFVDYSCANYQSANPQDPWEKCGNVSYSERCELCDVTNPNPRCECDILKLQGDELNECLAKCKEDPCGCIAYCEYKNSLKDPNDDDYVNLSSCTSKTCIKNALSTCVAQCEDRNAYCDLIDKPCWNRNGACGDGVIANVDVTLAGVGGTNQQIKIKNEKCDNYVSGTSHYSDFDGSNVNTTLQSGIGGAYCTGACNGSCDSESPMCSESVTSDCWQKGCTVADHGSGALSKCGDALVDKFAGEVCDEGYNAGPGKDLNGYYGHCNLACSAMLARCGDGTKQSGNDERNISYKEFCDRGDGNNGKYALNKADFCSEDCKDVEHNNNQGLYCGDGTIQNEEVHDNCNNTTGKDSQGLDCTSGVAGAHETCDPEDARMLSLRNADSTLDLDYICPFSSCKQPDRCGDGIRNPRFEGCDCGNGSEGSNGSGECWKDYYGLNTYGNGEGESGVKYKCTADCKADPIGNTNTVSPTEISGWACDPNDPMNHPAEFVQLQFKGKTTTGVTVKLPTNKDVDANVVIACGGGSKHGWSYNPSSGNLGIAMTDQPITVTVHAVRGSTKVKIGEGSFTLGQQCGDGIVTKCESIPIKPKNGSGSIKNGWKCLDEKDADNNAQSCGSNTKCIVVKGKCADYGLMNNVECVDEMCDEGAGNGSDKRCYDDTFGTACQYSYCGDGTIQNDPTNGMANSSAASGYNESSPNPAPFAEECEGATNKRCDELFTAPDGANFGDNTSDCNKGTCKWKRTDCTFTHACPSLKDKAESLGFAWEDGANVIRYAGGATSANYTRQWYGDSWEPEPPATLIHKDASSTNTAQNSCKFQCKDDEQSSDYKGATLKWNGTICEAKSGTLSCGTTCDDDNGGRYDDGGTWKPCTKSGWKTIPQTVSVSTDVGTKGLVVYNPSEAPAPYHLDTPNSNDCSYTCKEGTTYVNDKCLPNSKPSVSCGTAPTNAVWVKVTPAATGTNYTLSTTGAGSITQTLNNGTYSPATTSVYASYSNIVNGTQYERTTTNSQIYNNKCFYMCASGYYFNGNGACAKNSEDAHGCGDGKVNSSSCDKNAITNPATNGVTIGGKTYDCYYEPNPDNQELCDDGKAKNGKYLGSSDVITLDNGTKVSACNADCSGRIHSSDKKFFCGDGIVQYSGTTYSNTKGCGTNGATCSQVTGSGNSQYPGPGWTGTASAFISEECDPNDTKNNGNTQQITNKLCNLAKGTDVNNYTARSDITCSSTCTINNTNKCAICGNGTKEGDEVCDSGSSNSDDYGEHCNSSCTAWAPYCGDGTIQDNEECESNSFSPSTCYKQTKAESVDCTGGCGDDYKRYFDIYESYCDGCSKKWKYKDNTSICYDSSSSDIGVTLCPAGV